MAGVELSLACIKTALCALCSEAVRENAEEHLEVVEKHIKKLEHARNLVRDVVGEGMRCGFDPSEGGYITQAQFDKLCYSLQLD